VRSVACRPTRRRSSTSAASCRPRACGSSSPRSPSCVHSARAAA
jgi:hypothetical protein